MRIILGLIASLFAYSAMAQYKPGPGTTNTPAAWTNVVRTIGTNSTIHASKLFPGGTLPPLNAAALTNLPGTEDVTIRNSAPGVVPLTINAVAGTTESLLELKVDDDIAFYVSEVGVLNGNGAGLSGIPRTGVSGLELALFYLTNNSGTSLWFTNPAVANAISNEYSVSIGGALRVVGGNEIGADSSFPGNVYIGTGSGDGGGFTNLARQNVVGLELALSYLTNNGGTTLSTNYAMEFWGAARTDGLLPGDGSFWNPFDLSTQEKFDAVWPDGLAAYTTLNLQPGLYKTEGWNSVTNLHYVKAGQILRGAGMYQTTIQIVGATNASESGYSVIHSGDNSPYVVIENLTIDCAPGGNMATNVCVNGIVLGGSGSRISHVRAINWGSRQDGAECFVLLMTTQTSGPSTNNIIEHCVVQSPMTNATPVGAGVSCINVIGFATNFPGYGNHEQYSGIVRYNYVDGGSYRERAYCHGVGAGSNPGIVEGNTVVNCSEGYYNDTISFHTVLLRNNRFINNTRAVYLAFESGGSGGLTNLLFDTFEANGNYVEIGPGDGVTPGPIWGFAIRGLATATNAGTVILKGNIFQLVNAATNITVDFATDVQNVEQLVLSDNITKLPSVTGWPHQFGNIGYPQAYLNRDWRGAAVAASNTVTSVLLDQLPGVTNSLWEEYEAGVLRPTAATVRFADTSPLKTLQVTYLENLQGVRFIESDVAGTQVLNNNEVAVIEADEDSTLIESPNTSASISMADTGILTINGDIEQTGDFYLAGDEAGTMALLTAAGVPHTIATETNLIAPLFTGNGAGLTNVAGVIFYTNIAHMLVSTLTPPTAFVHGYSTTGDHGGGDFRYDADSSAATNRGTVFAHVSGTGRWLRMLKGDDVYVEEFGASGSVVDNSAAIQSALDWWIYDTSGRRGKIRFRTQSYGISNAPILIAKTNVAGTGFDQVYGLVLEADAPTPNRSISAEIVQNNTNFPAIIIQYGDSIEIKNLNLRGKNTFVGEGLMTTDGVHLDANYLSAIHAVRTNRYSPHAGLVTDPFANHVTLSNANQYPTLGAYYIGTNGGTARVRVQGVQVADFVAGFVMNPNPSTYVQQGDNFYFDQTSVGGCRFGWAIGQSESKAVTLNQCGVVYVMVGITTKLFGHGLGCPPVIISGQYGFAKKLFDVDTQRGRMDVTGIYTEGLLSLGIIGQVSDGNNHPVSFKGCDFRFQIQNGLREDTYGVLLAPINFDSCNLSTSGNNVPNFVTELETNARGSVTYRNCRFGLGLGTNAMATMTFTSRRSVRFEECYVYDTTISFNAAQLRDHVKTAALVDYNRQFLPFGANLFCGPTNYVTGVDIVEPDLTLSSFVFAGDGTATATADADTAQILRPGDAVVTRTSVGLPETDLNGNVITVVGQHVGRVATVVGTAVTFTDVPKMWIAQTPTSTTVRRLRRFHEPTTGNIANNVYEITGVSVPTAWAIGDQIRGTGIREGTVITNIVSSTFSISQPPTATATGVVLYDAQYWQTVKHGDGLNAATIASGTIAAARLPLGKTRTPLIRSQQTNGLIAIAGLNTAKLLVVSNSLYNAFPSVLIDSRGRLHVYYRTSTRHATDDGVLTQSITANGGKTFTHSTIDLAAILPKHCEDIASVIFPDGRIGLMVSADSTNGGNWLAEVYWMTSADDGDTWTVPVVAVASLGALRGPYIQSVIESDGVLIASGYAKLSPGDEFNSFVIRSTDSGQTWSAPIAIDPNVAVVMDEVILFRWRDQVVALIRNDTATSLQRSVSSDNGLTWGARSTVTPSNYTVSRPDVVVAGNIVQLIFRDTVNDVSRRTVSYDGGSTWSANEIINTGYGAYSGSVLADGNLIVSAIGREIFDAGGDTGQAEIELRTWRVGAAAGLNGIVHADGLFAGTPVHANVPQSVFTLLGSGATEATIGATANGKTIYLYQDTTTSYLATFDYANSVGLPFVVGLDATSITLPAPVTTISGETTFGAGGITANGGGLKHARVTTGVVTTGSTALVTVTWGTAFADANYTVQASVVDATTSSLSLSVVHIESVSASAVTVRVLNNAVGDLTGTVHVIAIHD